MPQVALRQVLGHQGHCVLEHAGAQELDDVAVVQGLEDGHLRQERLAAARVAGLQHLHGHRRAAVQLP